MAAMPTDASFDGLYVFGFKGSQAGFKQLSPRHHDNIESWCDLVTTKNLSYQSFSAISPDSVTQLFRGRDAQTPDAPVVRQHEDRAISTVNPDALPVHLLKVRTAADPLAGPQPCRRSTHYSLLTVRRLRPFARRLFSTRRPFFELIRTRNPWAFFRRRLFG